MGYDLWPVPEHGDVDPQWRLPNSSSPLGRRKVELHFDVPGMDVTFDWRGVDDYHPHIVLCPGSDLDGAAPITIRLLGYDAVSQIIGATTQTVVYTDDPRNTMFCAYDAIADRYEPYPTRPIPEPRRRGWFRRKRVGR